MLEMIAIKEQNNGIIQSDNSVGLFNYMGPKKEEERYCHQIF